MVSIKEKLVTGKPLLLDGATGTELEKQGLNINDPLWSGLIVMSHPEELEKLHLTYLNSGSDIILTGSYQLYDSELIKRNLDPNEIYDKSIKLCLNAQIKHFEKTGLKSYIAGSIGPYGVLFFDGSEYTGNYRNAKDSDILNFHFKKLEFFYNSLNVDLIAFETIPSFQEIKILIKLINSFNSNPNNKQKYYYLSCSVNDQNELADGTKWFEILKYLNENTDEYLLAIGSNCCKLNQSSNIINKINDSINKVGDQLILNNVKILIYPNSGEVYNGITKKWSTPLNEPNQQIDKMAQNSWLQCDRIGIIGGCCRTGPDDIKVLRSLIDKDYKS